jgi:hypothetical protein
MLTKNSNLQVISNHLFASVIKNPGNNQQSLIAEKAFAAGEIICSFFAKETVNTPTYLTVQLNEDTHFTLEPEFLQYINHSCAPNVFFNTTTMQLQCLKNIKVGNELTFFYPSTEWQMTQPFVCNCKNNSCLQLINGAANLDVATLAKYQLTDFIKNKAGL